MPLGPGKYDDIVTRIAAEVGITDSGGGVVLLVIGGNKGSGMSCPG